MPAASSPSPPEEDRAVAVAATLARWLDRRYLDPLLGLLLPGVGDFLGSALGFYPVVLAWRRRAPKVLLARMMLNLAVDAASGAIPLVGDLGDLFFRAHTRNYELLRTRAAGDVRSHWTDTLVVAGAFVVLLLALALPIVVFAWLWHAVTTR